MQSNYRMPLEELCARIIAMSRDFAEVLPISDVAADVLERNSLRRTLKFLARNGGLPARDDNDLDIIGAVLAREIERETLGWVQSFEGVVDPEIGAVGYDIEIRDLTDRGRRIDRQLKQLTQFRRTRSTCRARLDAAKIIMGR